MDLLIRTESLSSESEDGDYFPSQSSLEEDTSGHSESNAEVDSSSTTLEAEYVVNRSRKEDKKTPVVPERKEPTSRLASALVKLQTAQEAENEKVSSNRSKRRPLVRSATVAAKTVERESTQTGRMVTRLSMINDGRIKLVGAEEKITKSVSLLRKQSKDKEQKQRLGRYSSNQDTQVKEHSLDELRCMLEELTIDKSIQFIEQKLQQCKERRLLLESLLNATKIEDQALDDHLKTCKILNGKLAKENGNTRKVLLRKNLKLTEKFVKLVGFLHNNMEPVKNWKLLDEVNRLRSSYNKQFFLRGGKLLRWESHCIEESFMTLEKRKVTAVFEVFGINWVIWIETDTSNEATSILVSLVCLGVTTTPDKEETRLAFSASVCGKVDMTAEIPAGPKFKSVFFEFNDQNFLVLRGTAQRNLTKFRIFRSGDEARTNTGIKCLLRCYLFVCEPLPLVKEMPSLICED